MYNITDTLCTLCSTEYCLSMNWIILVWSSIETPHYMIFSITHTHTHALDKLVYTQYQTYVCTYILYGTSIEPTLYHVVLDITFIVEFVYPGPPGVSIDRRCPDRGVSVNL